MSYLKATNLPLQSCLEQAFLLLMNNHLVSFTCPKYSKLVLDNSRVRLPKFVWHVCIVCGSKFPAEPFTYANPLACLDVHLTDKGLSLSVPSVTVGESEIEVTNSNLLISDLLDTADLEALLNLILLEPGWLESLASS